MNEINIANLKMALDELDSVPVTLAILNINRLIQMTIRNLVEAGK